MFNLTLFIGLNIENSFWDRKHFSSCKEGFALSSDVLAFSSKMYVINAEKLDYQ